MNENERQQLEAVEAIEQEIHVAQTLKEMPHNIFDKVRNKWEIVAFKSTIGSWSIKLLLAMIVFFSLRSSMTFGLSRESSMFCDLLQKLPEDIPQTGLLFLVFQIALAILWLFMPSFGTFLYALLGYACFASLSPMVLLFAFLLLLFFQLEDLPVVAFAISLPAIIFTSSFSIGLFIAVLMAFVSIRKNNGTVRSLSILYWALLELCNCSFGFIRNSAGTRIIPAPEDGVHAWARFSSYFNTISEGNTGPHYFFSIWVFVLAFYLIGFFFSKGLGLKVNKKPLTIEVFDGILFGSLTLVFIASIILLKRFHIISSCSYSYFSIVMQMVTAYVITRPIAGDSPMRGNQLMKQDKNYIFISYAHADINIVKPYLKILKRRGYEFWYDDNIKTGTEWQGVIASNLAQCSCCLAFISKTSVTSDYCLKEINYATSKNKPLGVLVLEPVMLPPVLEMLFASLQIVLRSKYDTDEECLDKVLETDGFDSCKY